MLSLFGLSSSGKHQRRREVLRRSQAELLRDGWTVSNGNPVVSIGTLDFLISRGDLTLGVMTSGTDLRLKFTEVRDFCRLVRAKSFEPVFLHGEELDPSIITEAADRNAILLPGSDIGSLEGRLSILPVKGRGWIESFGSSGRASGWARLSPTGGKATIRAFRGDDGLGVATANIFREDMKAVGDACFGFDIQIPPMTAEQFLREVKLVAYHHNKAIHVLRAIDGLRILD